MPTIKERRKEYRLRSKTSKCRAVPPSPCKLNSECKYVNGSVRHYCRKKHNVRLSKSSSRKSSSADSRFSILNLRKTKDVVNDKRLIKTRIQPVTQKRKGLKNFFGLDDFRGSSSETPPNKLFKKPLQFKGTQPAKRNMDLNDNDHSF